LRILLVGVGTIGECVLTKLKDRHDVVVASRSKGDVLVDISSKESIEKMYEKVGEIDAVIVAAGKVAFPKLDQTTDEDFSQSINAKLMGQINLVRLGLKAMKEGGSFTLTSGLLNYDVIERGSIAALINGGLEGFVRSAAIEMPRQIRINVISPGVIAESVQKYGADIFSGFSQVKRDDVANVYVKSVEGRQTGQVYRIGWS